MFWTIVKRELLDHLMSLRFSAVFVLTILLLVISVSVFSGEYLDALKEFQSEPGGIVGQDGKTSLMMLPCNGWGVHRAPSSLAFLAGEEDRQIPNIIVTSLHSLHSIDRTPKVGEIAGGALHIDWAQAVALLLSFAAGLLTYKSVSGELRDGTLTLLLSNPVSKATLLAAKYVAALIALAVSLVVGILAGIVVLRMMGTVALTPDDWMKILFFALISILFLSVFVSIGLACSVFSKSPVISAVTFLLVWTIVVFVLPNVGGIIANLTSSVHSPAHYKELADAIPSKYSFRPGMDLREYGAIEVQVQKAREDLLIAYAYELLNQVTIGRNITRVSPASAYSYAAAEIAGLGTVRLRRFIDNVVRYRENLFEAVILADKGDPQSDHVYVPFRCGASNFSRQSVDLGAATHFDDVPIPAADGLAAASGDIVLLIAGNLLLVVIIFRRIARMDVAQAPGV